MAVELEWNPNSYSQFSSLGIVIILVTYINTDYLQGVKKVCFAACHLG